jgi:hypothetical protein
MEWERKLRHCPFVVDLGDPPLDGKAEKLMVNQALSNMGLYITQMITTVLGGMTRHTREDYDCKRRARENGWKQAVKERDQGSFDWTPIKRKSSRGHHSWRCPGLGSRCQPGRRTRHGQRASAVRVLAGPYRELSQRRTPSLSHRPRER